jgi:hypothetical protein
MLIDRDKFFASVRERPFGGALSQSQVDGLNNLLDIWEVYFAKENSADAEEWLAYCLATVFHESAQTMRPIEEYGKGQGKSYGEPQPPYDQVYYGRGHVQLTWQENYQKGEQRLKEVYGIDAPMHQYPHRMLEDETSAMVLFDGCIEGWFTGVGLPQFFNAKAGVEEPYEARQIDNGFDKADVIAGYYEMFKDALA